MKIVALLLADAANHTNDNKINLLGAGFNQWPRQQFPAKVGVVVFIRVETLSTEAGSHTVTLNLISGDGQPIIPSIQGQFNMPAGPPFYRYLNLLYNLAFQIPASGEYSFRVLLDGRDEASYPITAILLPAATTSESPPES